MAAMDIEINAMNSARSVLHKRLLGLCLLPLAYLSGASTASAQTVVGNIDIVDQSKVIGWTCLAGDPNTKLVAQLWAYNTNTGGWSFIGNQQASSGRLDVGNAGVCGTGTEAAYHGFEYTIYPQSLIASGANYAIYAYVLYAGEMVPINGSGGNINFAQSGFPTSTTWRTDYDDPNAKSVAMLDCIWPFKGANARGNSDALDMWQLSAGPTVNANWNRYSATAQVGPTWCAKNDPAQSATWNWLQSNSATNGAYWPRANFWVVSANSELAYSLLNKGPPSQSFPINAGSVYSLASDSNGFTLGVDNRRSDYRIGMFPFLSIGSEMGRGTGGVIKYVPASGPTDSYLNFDFRQMVQNYGGYHDIAVYIEAMWGGRKRVIGVSFPNGTRERVHWNWNAVSSFWFPGFEYNYIGASQLRTYCPGIPASGLPVVSDATSGTLQHVSIPVRKLFECIEQRGIPDDRANHGNLTWSDARNTGLPLTITGVHLSIEQGDNNPNDYMQTYFSRPTFTDQ